MELTLKMSKIAVVTGGNKGIGYGIVKDLLKRYDGIVYLTARNEERGLSAVSALNELGLHPRFHQLDIDNLESINKFRDYLKEKYNGLDCLVNNAAIAYNRDATEPFGEQAENTVRVNFTGTLNVCHALFPLLRPHARVVQVSSSSGALSKIPGKNLRQQFADSKLTEEKLCALLTEFVDSAKDGTFKTKGWPQNTYSVSKVGVSALARIQQREFDKDNREDLVVNHVHPGYVDTDMTNHKGPLTIEQGAVSSVHCALLPPNITSPKGAYIWEDATERDWTDGCL